jgi:AbrB family looped-hinge helix DNA binding protein
MINVSDSEKLVILGRNGRLVIPAAYRKKMQISAGDRLILRYKDGSLRIMTPHQAVQFAQSLVRRYVQEDRSLADELIAERKKASSDE